MNKQLVTGIVLAAALCATGRLMRKRAAARRASSAPASIPVVRAIWPVTEDIRELASRGRWRDRIEGWGSTDTDQHLRQRMSG
ncbi:MAG: hypothetical protein J0H22_06890, partial [Actinobacteria bacterium]|nr:hypothetical protein [Actinomycetota bacterium]